MVVRTLLHSLQILMAHTNSGMCQDVYIFPKKLITTRCQKMIFFDTQCSFSGKAEIMDKF